MPSFVFPRFRFGRSQREHPKLFRSNTLPATLPGPTPFKFRPQPRRRNYASVHPLLAISYPPLLRYNLLDHPSHIISTMTHAPIPSQVLAEAATNPLLPSLTLAHPRLMWQCVIRPVSNGSYITVFDVLDTLYRFLRTNVLESEYRSLPPDVQRRVYAAYQNRCSRLRGSRERYEERMKGVKRVDFLMESIRFQGLSPTNSGNTVWMINVS